MINCRFKRSSRHVVPAAPRWTLDSRLQSEGIRIVYQWWMKRGICLLNIALNLPPESVNWKRHNHSRTGAMSFIYLPNEQQSNRYTVHFNAFFHRHRTSLSCLSLHNKLTTHSLYCSVNGFTRDRKWHTTQLPSVFFVDGIFEHIQMFTCWAPVPYHLVKQYGFSLNMHRLNFSNTNWTSLN